MKTEAITIRMTEEDKRRLYALAKAARRTPTDMIRFLINETYELQEG